MILPTSLIPILLALSAIVSTAVPTTSEYELEPRVLPAAGGRIASTLGRTALRGASRVPLRTPAIRITTPPPPRPLAGSSLSKQVGAGMFLGKVGTGITVGAGSLAAQHQQNMMEEGEEKRELEPRTRAAAQRLIGSVGRMAARPPVRQMIRIPGQAPPPSSILNKAKATTLIGGTAFIAGFGEFHGGDAMGNMQERLKQKNAAEQQAAEQKIPPAVPAGGKREINDQLRSRTLAAKTARVGGAALRAARTGAVRGASQSIVHMPPPITVPNPKLTSKVGKGAFIATAAATGGFAEGMVQNIEPETQTQLRQDPKGTILKMLPDSPFKSTRREYVEDLVKRADTTQLRRHWNDFPERVVTRALVDMLLEELE